MTEPQTQCALPGGAQTKRLSKDECFALSILVGKAIRATALPPGEESIALAVRACIVSGLGDPRITKVEKTRTGRGDYMKAWRASKRNG
jgi:hypothetical protein